MNRYLTSCDPLVLQNPHYDASVLRLPLRCSVFSHLAALAHRARSQDFGQRNVTLLHQEISDIVGAVFAKLLIQACTASRRGIADYLDHMTIDGHSFLCQLYELRPVLRTECDFTTP